MLNIGELIIWEHCCTNNAGEEDSYQLCWRECEFDITSGKRPDGNNRISAIWRFVNKYPSNPVLWKTVCSIISYFVVNAFLSGFVWFVKYQNSNLICDLYVHTIEWLLLVRHIIQKTVAVCRLNSIRLFLLDEINPIYISRCRSQILSLFLRSL